jgi:hypothetical protein
MSCIGPALNRIPNEADITIVGAGGMIPGPAEILIGLALFQPSGNNGNGSKKFAFFPS